MRHIELTWCKKLLLGVRLLAEGSPLVKLLKMMKCRFSTQMRTQLEQH